jgi:SAM-dependent methyltransferase
MTLIPFFADSARILAHGLGLGKQHDALVLEKYTGIRDYYRGPLLDFGAGTCHFTMLLRQDGLEVIPVDVVNLSRYPEARLQLFDGRSLPFDRGAFQTSVAHFVLHHIRHQEDAFRELLRVTSGVLVIGEDVVDSWLDRFLAWIHTGTSPWSRSWSGFRSTSEWREFFSQFPVEVVEERAISRLRTPHYPIRRVVFVLRVKQAAAA